MIVSDEAPRLPAEELRVGSNADYNVSSISLAGVCMGTVGTTGELTSRVISIKQSIERAVLSPQRSRMTDPAYGNASLSKDGAIKEGLGDKEILEFTRKSIQRNVGELTLSDLQLFKDDGELRGIEIRYSDPLDIGTRKLRVSFDLSPTQPTGLTALKVGRFVQDPYIH